MKLGLKWKLFCIITSLFLLLSCGGDDSSTPLTDNDSDTPEITYKIDSNYLQYRTNVDPSNNHYRGWVGISNNDLPIEMEEIENIIFTDESGSEMVFTDERFWNGKYYLYDCSTGACQVPSLVEESGFYGPLDALSTGTYQIKVETADGTTITKDVDYPGKLELPVVNSDSMQDQWEDGDLILSWTNPTTAATWNEADLLRVNLLTSNYEDLIYVSVDPTEETITIPADLIEKAAEIGKGEVARWQIQVRANDSNGMNYARSISNTIPLSYSLGYAHLQYRTYENSSWDSYRLWLEVIKDGDLAAMGDFDNCRILDSTGAEISPVSGPSFWSSTDYYYYNCSTAPCQLSGPGSESGFYASIDNLPAGNYQLLVDTADGETLSKSIYYSGKLELPVISSSSMVAELLQNGDLTLSWTNPDSDANWSEVDQVRQVLYTPSGEALYVRVDPDVDTITIPASVIGMAEALSGEELSGWDIQARAYDDNGLNYARSVSTYPGP